MAVEEAGRGKEGGLIESLARRQHLQVGEREREERKEDGACERTAVAYIWPSAVLLSNGNISWPDYFLLTHFMPRRNH